MGSRNNILLQKNVFILIPLEIVGRFSVDSGFDVCFFSEFIFPSEGSGVCSDSKEGLLECPSSNKYVNNIYIHSDKYRTHS